MFRGTHREREIGVTQERAKKHLQWAGDLENIRIAATSNCHPDCREVLMQIDARLLRHDMLTTPQDVTNYWFLGHMPCV